MNTDYKTKLSEVLSHFGIKGETGEVFDGPVVYDVQFKPADGSRFSAVENYIRDISRELGVSGVRASEVADSPYISFEIPKPEPRTVHFAEVANSEEFLRSDFALPLCIGVDMRGKTVMKDLSKMPHLLVAGTTGSGKSVGLNSFILSLIKKKSPDDLKFVLIDPKRIEFGVYNNQKYMLRPVITDMSEASACLAELVTEMNSRYAAFEKNTARNIGEYKAKGGKMPYIVCVIDEFADLIMSDKSVEKQVLTLAQKSRAAGIHLIIATQRPSVDVITGTVKANLPTRLSYKVSSPADSMTILNTDGAEDLLGRGDSLLLEENGTLTRILGAYASDDDIRNILQPYHCEIKIPAKQTDAVTPAVQTASAETNTQSKKSIFSALLDFWSRLGKRNQNRIINFLASLILSFFGAKSTSPLSARKSGKRR